MFETPPPSGLQAVLEEIKSVGETLGLIIGGLWAYYKFFKGRTFKPRLELSLTGEAWHTDHLTHLIASVQLKNVGLSKSEISQEGTGLRISSQEFPEPRQTPATAKWKWQITVPVFERHKWIEPGETIADQALITLGDFEHGSIKMEFRIVSNGIEWNSLTIIKPGTKTEHTGKWRA